MFMKKENGWNRYSDEEKNWAFEFSDYYKNFLDKSKTDNSLLVVMKEVIDEIISKELYIYYKINSRKSSALIVKSLEASRWGIRKKTVLIDGVMSKKPITISRLYIILLAKSPDSYLSTASP